MRGSEQESCAKSISEDASRLARLRSLNDVLRTAGRGGRVCITAGIVALGTQAAAEVLQAVRKFDTFNEGNDPHGEHDFGALKVSDERIFWKIDYYDRECLYGSPDPADATVTTRILTIMLATEY